MVGHGQNNAVPSFETDRIGFDEAARITGLASTSLQLREIRERLSIPHYKVGRRIFFRRSEIEAWVEGRRQGKTIPRAIPVYSSEDSQ